MTDQQPEQNGRSVSQLAGQAGLALARSIATQPVQVAFIIVVIALLVAVWKVSGDQRKLNHLEMQLMLERCLPSVIHNQPAP